MKIFYLLICRFGMVTDETTVVSKGDFEVLAQY